MIDRAGHRRKDEDFVAAALAGGDTRLVIMRGGQHLFGLGDSPRALLPRLGDAPALSALLADCRWALLGTDGDGPILAVDLGETEGATFDPVSVGGTFGELRAAASGLTEHEIALLFHARGMINWRRRHLFCGVCGAACRPVEAGHVMECTGCGAHHFPRTDPAVIMLVRRGDRALLARSARFEGNMFSALAGFVEPGETLEEAVAREVEEECGVRVTDVAYRSSQPWPFPASVMLGFMATTEDERIEIDDDEIVEARWFTRADIKDRKNLNFSIPPRLSIARALIDEWCGET
jgi:NAD+ diphosphatase